MPRFDSSFEFDDIFEPVTENEIGAFEEAIGCRLPEDYRAFLLAHNGVLFKDIPYFRLQDEETEDRPFSSVNLLWSLFRGKPEEPRWFERAQAEAGGRAWEDLREGGIGLGFKYRVPAGIIAIGDNCGNERICISVAGDDRGCVYLWRPAMTWEDEPRPTREELHLVAKSFADFWNSFLPEDAVDDKY